MIPDIREIDFPDKDGVKYATLSNATVNLPDMAEKSPKVDNNASRRDIAYSE